MKKFLLVVFALLLMAVPCGAEGINKPVAVKCEDGVYLSWMMEEEGKEYTVYRDGVAIVTTNVTNYLDSGASGNGKYMINDTPVDVWENQYIEVPVSIPNPYDVNVPDMEHITLTANNGYDIALGNEWYLYDYGNGYFVFVNEEGKCLDVLDRLVAPGTELLVYSYTNADNQRFVIENENGKAYIKGEQSQLYLTLAADGKLTIDEKSKATAFTVKKTNKAMTEAVETAMHNALVFATYGPGDASVGDLDGDGEWEIVLKWDPSNLMDSSHGGTSGKVFIDAYELDGTLKWRIDLGVNIRAGAHDTQFVVYDLDNDGKAEVATRISDGTVDGVGNVIGNPNKDWRDGGGRNLEGPLYLAVFDGDTGALLAKTDFEPQNVGRATTESFGDGYGNRSERYNACVAYVDGKTPHVVFQRGYYARTVVAAYKYENGTVSTVWKFDTSDEGMGQYGGNGNHQISVADVDNDGCDEIFLGSLAIDHDGSLLWCSFQGHGDAMHLGDFDPDREGMEFFSVHEWGPFGYTIYDAATGDILFDINGGKDTGRGLILNSGPFRGNYIANATGGSPRINSYGEPAEGGLGGVNFRIYWDGDLYEETLNATTIDGFNEKNEFETYIDTWQDGCSAINGSKATPCLTADIFGDWREEVIWKTQDNTALRIYTTTIPTEFAVPSLMTDHTYRMGVVWQNSSYNQPPHLGYYLESGLRLWIGNETADINGVDITMDAAPYIANGRTMVPLRFISEMFDFDVEYDNGKVRISKYGSVFETVIGTKKYTMNGLEKTMDTESVIVNDRTMVPVRLISEAFGMNVEWSDSEKMVTITRGKARKNAVDMYVVGDSNDVGSMLKYFFDESVTVKENEAITQAKEGDYVILFENADVSDLSEKGVNVIDVTDVDVSADYNHGKFKAAEKVAENICYLIDGASRKGNGYIQKATLSGEQTFNVDIWGNVNYYKVVIEGNATVDINNETYLTWEMDDAITVYVTGGEESLTIKCQGTAAVTIEPCDTMEASAFNAPSDMEKVSSVAGIDRYENETRVTLYNSMNVTKKVKVGNSIVNVMPKNAISYEKKVWE